MSSHVGEYYVQVVEKATKILQFFRPPHLPRSMTNWPSGVIIFFVRAGSVGAQRLPYGGVKLKLGALEEDGIAGLPNLDMTFRQSL